MNKHPVTYYWTYILIATVISTITLYHYAKMIPELIDQGNISIEILMCSGQVIWQGCILLMIKKPVITYLYHMITVSLLGSLALIPFLIINQCQLLNLEIRVVFFFCIISLMILEHARRTKRLRLPIYLTITWVCYRILWLPILL